MSASSIKYKITKNTAWILFSSGLITITVVMAVTYQQTNAQKINDLKSLSFEKSDKVSILLQESSDLASYLASFPQVAKWAKDPSPKNTEAALSFFKDFNVKKKYAAIYIMDKNGTVPISTDATFVGNNYSFRPYFKKAISGKANMDVSIGSTSLTQGYYFAEPIKDIDNTVIGVLVLKLSPESVYTVLENTPRSPGSHIMLADQYGVIIYSDLKGRIFHSLGTLNPSTLNQIKTDRKYLNLEIKPIQYQKAQNIINTTGETGTNIYNYLDVEDRSIETIAITPVNHYPLYLLSEDSTWELSLGALRLAAISGLLILLSILIALLSIFRLLTRRLEPIIEINGMIKEVGSGNLNIENNIKSGDELEKLGDFIVQMAQEVKGYYNELEEKIKVRTKELASKNEYLNKNQSAIINILEDVEGEKDKNARLAEDLKKFKLALDSSSDHIVITDSEGITIYGNSMVEKLTGYSLEEALGKKAGTLWSYPMPKDYYENLWKIIKTNKLPFYGELKNKRKNGEVYEARLDISPVLNDKGEAEFFIGVERDITHEKMVDQAKTEFVSLASHQLRTPLSSVNWYAEMLLAGDGGALKPEQKTFVEEIYAGNQRMVELVNALLNVSRLELGTFAVEPEPINVIETADSVIKELQPIILKKKLKINFNYLKDIPIIQADPKLLRIVLQNLMSNAVKYTPDQGSVSLEIGKNRKDLLITVADTGYGIPKKDQPRIFEKLFRAQNVREKDTEGTGLGLYIIKSIIEQAGGIISFKSKENKGTTFYLNIPLTGMRKKTGTKKLE
ncbi:MAG: PAS domain S-box protein [Candidatus Falkowbacteria bacterium]|nr:MAG: PAS domain S-box protein [Candidatus Falkowbacteria bacterium]